MGKNDHGPRGKQKPKKAVSNVPDSEHVVFSNAKEPHKKADGKHSTGRDRADDPSKGAPATPGAQPKRPDARTLIGGNASWSGKLPVNLLSEHCQKQKWEKPEYTMRQNGNGFESSVILKSKNPKTQELSVLPPFRLPASHRNLGVQPTALEARHFAAVYALFRVSSMKNVQMALPPSYRDFWKGAFTEIKQLDIGRGNAWQYESDPFSAQRAHDTVKADAARKAEASRNAAGSSATAPHGLSKISGSEARAWDRAPSVEMGQKLRVEVENIARNQALWNSYSISMSAAEKTMALNSMSKLGFRPSHVEEAIDTCESAKEVLEWLLIHVPEDDLPQWCLPEGYVAGISFASGDLAKDAVLKRLAGAGYSLEMCKEAYSFAKGELRVAAATLQASLLMRNTESSSTEIDSSSHEEWKEEMMAVEAIFGSRFVSKGPDSCSIQAETEVLPFKATFQFWLPCTPYPACAPTLAIFSSDLPSQIRLSATRQAILSAEASFLGSAMIFSIVEWLENNLQQISQNPGALREVTPKPIYEPAKRTQQQTYTRPSARVSSQHLLGRSGDTESIRMKDAWKTKQSDLQQRKMLNARQGLPAWSVREDVVDKITRYQITIISGATGSGKSTQCVQYVLDDMIATDRGSTLNIICTQPRRISALGLADRVSAERCTAVGQEVGYIIRGDSKVSPETTRITFMTTGVLLRRLQSSETDAKLLEDVSHVFIDEVHERSLDTDILLTHLRDLLKIRPALKIVMMSATLDAKMFMDYFGGPSYVGQAEISGRTFPIKDLYLDEVLRSTGYGGTMRNQTGNEIEADISVDLEDNFNSLDIGRQIRSLGMGINYELIAHLVYHIDSDLQEEPGSILIFLPGVAEIDRCLNALRQQRNVYALPLHASLSPSEQRRVFDRPPRGLRKVIAATNVAETSITIDDTVAVVDSGRVKETSYVAESGIVRLEEVWCSQAACQQRRGRAGRVRPGICYKLFTRKVESEMAARPEPEIRRVPLEQLCLSVKATSSATSDVKAFLSQTLTPPEDAAVDTALVMLHRIGALENSHLTALGRHMSLIPVDLRLAKLLVYGSMFSLLEPGLTVAALLSERSPFVSPRDKRDEADSARKSFQKSPADGDLLVSLNAYEEWSSHLRESGLSATRSWANSSFLSIPVLQNVTSTRAQLLRSLIDAGIVPSSYTSLKQPQKAYSANLLRAIISGSLTSQHASISFPSQKFASSISGSVAVDPEARTIKYFSPDLPKNDADADNESKVNLSSGTTTRVFIHPSSCLFSATPATYPSGTHYISYFSKIQTSKPFIRDCTPFNVYALLLFGGNIIIDPDARGLRVDMGTWRVKGWPRIGVLIGRLKTALDGVLKKRLQNYEDGRLEGLGDETSLEEADEKLLKVVNRLIEFNGLDQ
ncbi:MAG: hypothetical protein Q9160_002320 [Pyrenula sp. 1 TL-2023]